MPELTKTPRLLAAAKEFNIGKDTLVEFLTSKGFDVGDVKPTTRLTEGMYDSLQDEFKQDKANKHKSDQIDLPKGVSMDGGKKEEALPDTKTKQSTEDNQAIAQPDKESKEAGKEQHEQEFPLKAPKLNGPKVVTTIDLNAINQSTRPKKQQPEKEGQPQASGPAVEQEPQKPEEQAVEAKESQEEIAAQAEPQAKAEQAEPQKPEEKVAAEETPEKEESQQAQQEEEQEREAPKVENIKAKKLQGPKLVGKIELPKTPEKKENRNKKEKRKRKRIPLDKKPEIKLNKNDRSRGKGRPDRRDRKFDRKGRHQQDKEIDEKEIQEKIKDTLAKMGSTSRSKGSKSKYRRARREEMAEQQAAENTETNVLQVTEFIPVSELANLMDASFADVISKCMQLGIMVSINQRIDAEVIELVASEFGYEVEFIGVEDQAEMEVEEVEDDEEDLRPRAPIVTIMGHVDHGKTSLLDYIRSANVIAGEMGGITQHIGAYEVTIPETGKNICFLDTPGHEAFTAMRARGAKITDIAVIVIAADDAVMPQTREAISHAQAANVPMIFAINKIDKEGANPEKIKEQLSSMNLLVEDWGGKYQSQEISAKAGTNVDQLMEKILLEAELLDLKANPDREASGNIIEASLDKGRGYVATALIQNGTLKIGDLVVSGSNYGRVKAMSNERGQRMELAPPSTPVQLLGLNGAPQAGEKFKVFEEEGEAKELANRRAQLLREQGIRAQKHITLEEIGRRLALGNFKELNLIIKGDVDGSVEALSDSLQKLSTEEIVVSVVHKGVGQITESDVLLATASDAIIVGFQVRPSLQAGRLAERENIEIRTYSIIYDAIEEIRSAMEGMLEPKIEEKATANVEIKDSFRFDKVTVAGCQVMDGKLTRNAKIHLIRDGIVIYTGELGSLKRYKDDVREIAAGMECGLSIKNYNDIKVGDMLEAFEEVEVKRTL